MDVNLTLVGEAKEALYQAIEVAARIHELYNIKDAVRLLELLISKPSPEAAAVACQLSQFITADPETSHRPDVEAFFASIGITAGQANRLVGG